MSMTNITKAKAKYIFIRFKPALNIRQISSIKRDKLLIQRKNFMSIPPRVVL